MGKLPTKYTPAPVVFVVRTAFVSGLVTTTVASVILAPDVSRIVPVKDVSKLWACDRAEQARVSRTRNAVVINFTGRLLRYAWWIPASRVRPSECGRRR